MNFYQIYPDTTYELRCPDRLTSLFPDPLRLPSLYCTICKGKHTWGSDYPIPEIDLLPDNHPLLAKLRKLHEWALNQIHTSTERFIEALNKAKSPSAVDQEIQDDVNRAGTLTYDQFNEIACEIRKTLDLPAERVIGPFAQLGLRHMIRCFHPICDIEILDINYPTFTIDESVHDALLSIGASGWFSYPIIIDGIIPCISGKGIFDMRRRDLFVTGNGGCPANYDKQYYHEKRCPECGQLRQWITNTPEIEIIDDNVWDGSDFFRLLGTLGVFVTERIKVLFDDYEFDGALFRPSTVPYSEWK